MPITYFEMANEDGSLKSTAFDRLEWFIEQASKREIYTLIDMHGAFGSQNGKDHSGDTTIPDKGAFFGNEENIQKTIALWEEIARRYKDNEWVAGYDLLNEPGGALGTEQFEVYDRIYDAIRAIDQDHIIQMQAIWEPTHLPNPKLYGWENVVYQYHFYGWNVEKDADGQKAFIESKVKFLEETNFNVPVFVGEFTFFSTEKSWEALDIFDEQGWSYTSWTYKVSGNNSSWGMYTMPNTEKEVVDIYNDDFNTIESKWSSFKFTRNDKYANPLKEHFTAKTEDKEAPIISGNNATVKVGTKLTVEDIIDLFIKDEQDGVMKPVYTTNFDANQAGKYVVVVEVTDKAGHTAKKEFTIEVVSEPTLTCVKNEIVVGNDFDSLADLVIIDANGEVYTGEVTIVSNNVNVNKPGEYTIVYSIKDAFGNDVTLERKIIVVKATDENNPSTDKPNTGDNNTGTGDKPSTDKPSTDQPSTDKPSTDKPSTDKPSTDKPSTDNPSTDNPSTDKPGTDNPSTDKPSTDKPSTGNQQTDTGKKPHQTVQVSQTSQDDNQKTPDNTVTVVGTVQTSDDMNILPYAMIAGLAFIGILYGLKKRKMN